MPEKEQFFFRPLRNGYNGIALEKVRWILWIFNTLDVSLLAFFCASLTVCAYCCLGAAPIIEMCVLSLRSLVLEDVYVDYFASINVFGQHYRPGLALN